MVCAAKKKLFDNKIFVAQHLALALFTVGVVNSLGSDDLLAAFAAGKLSHRFHNIYVTHSF